MIQEQVDDNERIVIMSSVGGIKVSVKKRTEHIIGKHFAVVGKWVMNLRKNAQGQEMDDLRGLNLTESLPKMILIVPKEE